MPELLVDSGRETRGVQRVKRIVQLTEEGQVHGYVLRGGLLFKKIDGNIRLIVPKAMCFYIIRLTHERGHFSVAKTEVIVNRDYYIQNLCSKIEKLVRNYLNFAF